MGLKHPLNAQICVIFCHMHARKYVCISIYTYIYICIDMYKHISNTYVYIYVHMYLSSTCICIPVYELYFFQSSMGPLGTTRTYHGNWVFGQPHGQGVQPTRFAWTLFRPLDGAPAGARCEQHLFAQRVQVSFIVHR